MSLKYENIAKGRTRFRPQRTGPDSRQGKIVFVPLQVAFMEWDGRIVNVTEESNAVHAQLDAFME